MSQYSVYKWTMWSTVLFLACAVIVAGHRHGGGHRHDHGHRSATETPDGSPVTNTPSGLIKGSWMESRRGRPIQAYRGIRYAEPPVGELRFQPPKLIEKYSSDVDASKEGPACPQPVEQEGFLVNEDCLRLNVYTPRNNNSLPVIVYIHSGGFYSISGRSDVAGPHYLLDRDVVLVTINYRLGSLGFLSTGDKLAPGNNGYKDQVAALRWVRRNIASFGGNPELVTIAGCSAGSFSVMLHMISPMSKGLFHRAVSISGSPISQVEVSPHQRHLAVKQAQLLNCPTDSSKAILDCLKTKSSKELGDSLLGFFEFAYDPVLIWAPIVEPDFGQERFLPIHPLDAVKQGRMHTVPYIISQTHDEFFWKAFTVLDNQTLLTTMNSDWRRIAPISFYLSRQDSGRQVDALKQAYLQGKQLTKNKETADKLGKLYSDAIIGFGVHRLANLMCRHSDKPVYYYQFNYIGAHSHYENPVTKKPVGAAHHDDLIYLFTISALFPAINVSNSEDSKMVDKMTAIMYNFARHGDPNPRGDTPELSSLSWPVMTPIDRKYLRVDKHFSVQEKLFEDRFSIWDDLFPISY